MVSKEVRCQRKINEFGSRNPRCVICGREDIFALKPTKLTTSIIEEHHIAGHHEGETIPVCLSCHAILTNEQLDWPNEAFHARTPEMQAVFFFMGLALLFTLLAVWCGKHAQVLFDFVSAHQEIVEVLV